jgi:hypothetical protein
VPVARTVDVAPERLGRWVAGFVARHGAYTQSTSADLLTLVATDGATAVFEPPFLPLSDGWSADRPIENLASWALAPRTVGVLLVRLGGYAAGVFDSGQLVASKTGARPVHGRSAAGGWSQHRFARRREGQVKLALGAAVGAALAVLVPAVPALDVVVTGGDRQALRTVLGDVRLAALAPLLANRVLAVPDPKASVLRESIHAATAVRITISDPS